LRGQREGKPLRKTSQRNYEFKVNHIDTSPRSA
jgi:hypothetical protein